MLLIFQNKINGTNVFILQSQEPSNEWKKYTTLGYIVSQILLNLEHAFRLRIVRRMC